MMNKVKNALVVGLSFFLGGVCTAQAGVIEDLGPEMWFDAMVASSITANGSNQVTSWADLTSGGRIATRSASDDVLLANNGQHGTSAIDFTAGGTMSFNTNQVSTGKTVFTLFQSEDTDIVWTNPIGGNFHLTDGDNPGYRGLVRGGGAIRIQEKLSRVNEWSIQTMEYDISDRYSLWVDGNLEGTLTNASATDDFNGLGLNGFNGSIAQVVVFDGTLTPTQRQGVEQQMRSSLASTIHVGGENTLGTDIQTGTQNNEVITPGVTGARFVKVVQNVDDALQVAELQAFETDTGINASLTGTATAEDSDWGSTPSRANDDNTDMNWGGSSVWHSESGAGTWLQIELSGDTDLDSVHFWGRSDCCQSRQGDFNLILEDASHTELFNRQIVGLGSTPPYHGDIPVETLVSADLTAPLVDIHTYVFELDLDSNDQWTVDNPDPDVYTTILDVNDATIEVKLMGDLVVGDVYQLLNADSIIGTYDNLILPAGVDARMLLVNGTVMIVPEPASAALALMGLVALSLFARRRRQQA